MNSSVLAREHVEMDGHVNNMMEEYIEDSNFVCDVYTPTSELMNQPPVDSEGELREQPGDPRMVDGETSPEFESVRRSPMREATPIPGDAAQLEPPPPPPPARVSVAQLC